MILYKFRKKLIKYSCNIFNYYSILLKCVFIIPKKKKVFFDIVNIEKNRYLSNLIKFFKLQGYTVYLPNNKNLISSLCIKTGEFKYASFILNGDVKIGKPRTDKDIVFLSVNQLSNDYFKKNIGENSYHIPMSQYPILYDEKYIIDTQQDVTIKRKMSVFMSGNFNSVDYSKIATDGFFDILSRREVFDFIVQRNSFHELNSFEDLLNFIDSPLDCKTILIDGTNKFRIKLLELKYILQQFNFFMALPGILIPQSHNLIEAMEVGCIPIIHKTYSDLLYPPLIHNENAIIYQTKEELDFLINAVFELGEEEILFLRNNVLNYYDKYLTPKAVVNSIVNNNFDKIYIQAEHISLNLLKNKKL